MKRMIMFTTLAFISTFAFAAVAQDAPAPAASPSVSAPLKLTTGTMTFGGSIYYGSTSNTVDYDGNETDMDTSIINIKPSFGYFIMDNVELAITLSYVSEEQDDDESSNMGFAVGANYYMPLSDKLVLSAGAALMVDMTEWGDDFEMTQYGLVANVSALYPLLPSLALEAGLNISYILGTVDSGGMEAELSGFGFQLGYFGIRAFF